ncbi:hypothetical protein E2986_14038 [Frieseomelitta varia]|uniref:Uncharacterized protein n=1 Tax=Frieseomelitta varia TaxID=561572 RepID=A0A833VM71_9HYME|nr:hypothetical protein E2986_14038 [Frieseomelitta varia]
MAMIGANLRFGIGASGNVSSNATKRCFFPHKKQIREGQEFLACFRWSQGLLFHQAMVDCARAAILLPLGSSILNCQPMTKCSLVETAFLLLVTVSTVNMLTTVLNDSPIFPETDEEADLAAPLLMDSPQAIISIQSNTDEFKDKGELLWNGLATRYGPQSVASAIVI